MMKAICLVALLGGTALAQDEAPMQKVEVSAIANADEKSYRKMLKGLQAFRAEQALAPQASLRFKMYAFQPSKTKLEGLSMRISGDTVHLPIVLDADYTFALEENAQAAKEDAGLMANRKSGTLMWKPWVVTPGLPADTRRLGDLRLQCKVTYAAGLEHGSNFLIKLFTGSPCTAPEVRFNFFAERAVFGITLESGARRRTLFSPNMYSMGIDQTRDLKDRTYGPPLGDTRWPDDTLVHIDYADGPNLPSPSGTPFDALLQAIVPGTTHTSELRAPPLAKKSVRKLLEGREHWSYTISTPVPAAKKDEKPVSADVVELALLIDAKGIIQRSQVRAARINIETGQFVD